MSTLFAQPAPIRLTDADRAALVATWNLGTLVATYPQLRGYTWVLRAGTIHVTGRLHRPTPAQAQKQTIPARPGETARDALLRLAAQAALNRVAVTPVGDTFNYFRVSSQEPDGGDGPYVVEIFHQVTCTCRRGRVQPGAPCAHIGAVYLWLRRTPEHQAVLARAEAEADAEDLWGPAA